MYYNLHMPAAPMGTEPPLATNSAPLNQSNGIHCVVKVAECSNVGDNAFVGRVDNTMYCPFNERRELCPGHWLVDEPCSALTFALSAPNTKLQ